MDRIGFYLVVALVGVLLLGLRIYLRSRVQTRTVKVVAVPVLFERLQERAREGAYIAFIPPGVDGGASDASSFQISVLNGRIGLEWAPSPAAAPEKRAEFAALARSLGHAVGESTVQGAPALRVEDGDLVALCRRALREIARVPDDGEIEFMQVGLGPKVN